MSVRWSFDTLKHKDKPATSSLSVHDSQKFPSGMWCQWWLLKRYGGFELQQTSSSSSSQSYSQHRPSSHYSQSSGLLREVTWLYTMVRNEWIECERLSYGESSLVASSASTSTSTRSKFGKVVTLDAKDEDNDEHSFSVSDWLSAYPPFIDNALKQCDQIDLHMVIPPSAYHPVHRSNSHSQLTSHENQLLNIGGSFCSMPLPLSSSSSSSSSQLLNNKWRQECRSSNSMQFAYAVLLSQPEDFTAPNDHTYNYFDYTHAMVHRICQVSLNDAIPILVLVTSEVTKR
jgi:hypothetical protein